MLDNQCNTPTAIPTSRLERLLRERELRRSTRASYCNEESRDGHGDGDVSGSINDLCLSDCETRYPEEGFFEGNASSNHMNDGCEKQDPRFPKQRLLVVANRLPVSAIRKSEDSWALEISVGGLVSALLGKSCVFMSIMLLKLKSIACFLVVDCFSISKKHWFPISS